MKFRKKKENKIILFQTVVCKDCGKKHKISYPFDLIWENGNIKCHCGIVIDYNNDRLDSLYS